MNINPQAEKLNQILLEKMPLIYYLLSLRGKEAFFPLEGILGQSKEAKETVINATIGQAFEDDQEPMVLDCFKENVKLSPSESFIYSPSHGQIGLRKLWKEFILKKNPSLTETSLPLVANALTHGLFIVGQLFVETGEKIIIPDKFWENYRLVFPQAELELFHSFVNKKFNLAGLKEKLLAEGEKKIVLLNFPNNPTGYTLTEKEAEEIVEIFNQAAAEGNKFVVLCDDAYFGLAYEQGVYRQSIFSRLAGLHQNILAIKLDGLTKECYAWGLRVGFITYGCKGMNPEIASILENKTAGIIRGTVSNVCTHSQYLALKALSSAGYEKQAQEKFDLLKERYETVKRILDENKKYQPFFTPLPFNSGYFMCVELKKHSGEEVRKRLIENYSTGVIAIGNLLRIAYSSIGKEKIPVLFENIYRVCKEINIQPK